MTDAIQGLVSEAKRNKFSTIGENLTNDDVCSVWDNVSAFIEKQMGMQKGVNIPGLGAFTLSQKKLEVGNNRFIMTQRPVFILSEKFAQIHGLNYTKYCTTGQIPVVQLNYSVLACESPFNRDTVEACVREVIQALSRSIAQKKNVDFSFTGIGRLQIRDSKVKMRFYKEYITSMDGSGKLLESMKDRPGTLDSVISNRSQTHSVSYTPILPKIGQGNGSFTPELDSKMEMPTIDEEDATDEHLFEEKSEFRITDPTPEQDFVADVNYNENEMKELLDEFDTVVTNGDSKKIDYPPSHLSSRAAMPVTKVSGISLTEDFLAEVAERKGSVLSKSSQKPLLKRSLSPLNHPCSAQTPRLTPLDDMNDAMRVQSADTLQKNKLPHPLPRPLYEEVPKSSCGHKAGQELCYLCHQRERRNVPVPLAEERKKQEEAEERVLQQFQHLQDIEVILKEQEINLAKKLNEQRIAAFNLGISEATNTKKRYRSYDFQPSYVFQNRPLTPPRFFKHDQYYKELSEQISTKYGKIHKKKSDEEFLERLEQVQLAEDLAAQREQYLKDKKEHQEHYKKALSAQVRFKPLPLPAAVPDSSEPIFGKDDMNNEQMAEKRRKANELYKEQQAMVERQKRQEILRRLQEQNEAMDMLKRNKQEYSEDKAERYQRSQIIRKQLEQDWAESVQHKKLRDQQEKEHICNAGLLLTDQFDKYKRCLQCKRRLNNCGETNIWKESHYIPGSRIMV